MKTNKAVETHNAIIQAAEALFMEKSVSKVTINDIVKKAGVAKGTFYLYFESKDHLVWHFLDHQLGYADKWLLEIAKYGYTEKDIDAIVDFLIQFAKRHMPLLKMIHHVRFYEFLGIKNMKNKYLSKWIEPMALWLEKGRLSGELTIEDAKFTAFFLVISIHEMFDYAILGEMPFNMDELAHEFKFLLKKLLK